MPANTMADLLSAILDQMAIDKAEILAAIQSSQMSARKVAPASGSASETLPNYGRAKGQPIRGASMGDLEYYANGCRRSLDDPAKARWHATERERLAAIEAEIARQTGGNAEPPASGGSYPPDDDIPF